MVRTAIAGPADQEIAALKVALEHASEKRIEAEYELAELKAVTNVALASHTSDGRNRTFSAETVAKMVGVTPQTVKRYFARKDHGRHVGDRARLTSADVVVWRRDGFFDVLRERIDDLTGPECCELLLLLAESHTEA